jgi:anti-sigma28 factor (negative regulator of flagellin synthesis)
MVMVNVSSVSGSSGVGSVGRAEAREIAPERPAASGSVQRGEDQLELSEASRLLARLRGLPEIRQELVDQVRAQIESGGYETEEKIDAAIEAMLDDLESGL